MRNPPLVSVIVPAYNAEATLDDTLKSVRSQTHRKLEIVVVDDGSTDKTAALAECHAALDLRVRVMRQANAGVAAARNSGIAATCGEYVAPIDADDLWAPTKIERQLQAAAENRRRVGLVYTWFCVIDQSNRILWHEDRGKAEGQVLPQLLMRNLVGNGSSALLLRSALETAGVYDVTLRERGFEGAEDFSLYLKIAEHFEFALVPEFLTAYREYPNNMSNDATRMVRSRDACVEEIASKYPQLNDAIEDGRIRFLRFMIGRSVRERRFRLAAHLFSIMLRRDPVATLHSIVEIVGERATREYKYLFSKLPESVGSEFKIGTPELSYRHGSCLGAGIASADRKR